MLPLLLPSSLLTLASVLFRTGIELLHISFASPLPPVECEHFVRNVSGRYLGTGSFHFEIDSVGSHDLGHVLAEIGVYQGPSSHRRTMVMLG